MSIVTRISVRRAIYGKMSGDTTLNGLLASPPSGYAKSIYINQAPEGAEYPFVIFSKISGVPTRSFQSGQPAFTNEMWLIKGVACNPSTNDEVDAIASRIEALLTNGALTISGATQLYLAPESDVDYPETTEGITYQHAGARYRLVHQPT